MANLVYAIGWTLLALYFVIVAIGGGSWGIAFFSCSTCFYAWQMPLPRKVRKSKPPKPWEDHVV